MNAKQCETCFYKTALINYEGYCHMFREEPEGDKFCTRYGPDNAGYVERANSAIKKEASNHEPVTNPA